MLTSRRSDKGLYLTVFLFLLTGLAACSATKDPSARVSDALTVANMVGIQVEYDVTAGVVHLRGIVPTHTDRNRAFDVATRALASSAAVSNELAVNEQETTVETDDQRVKKQVEELVRQDRTLRLRAIQIEVAKGVVKIGGTVASVGEKNRVGRLARGVIGVLKVTNDIKVRRPPTPPQRSRDRRV